MADFSSLQWQGIMQLVYNVHNTQNAKDLRLALLKDIAGLIPHQRSFFDLCSMYRGQKVYFDAVSLNMDKAGLDTYYEHYADIDYTGWLLNQLDESTVYRDSDYFTDKLRRRSRLYTQWLKPMGVYYSSGFTLLENGTPYGSLTLFRGKQDGDFTDTEVRILKEIMPHVAQRFVNLYPNGVAYNAHQPQFRALQERFLLTAREDEIVRLLYAGLGTDEIAAGLFIAPTTVQKHIANIYAKLQVRSRGQMLKLVSRFLEEKDTPPPP